MHVGKPGEMLEYLKRKYAGKRVFLTGHTGFKGSWLLKVLSMAGAEVRGYSLAPQNTSDLYFALNGDSLCDSVIADLRDQQAIVKAIGEFKPDYIFHLAAQALVRPSYEFPSETFSVNAIGTAHLLDCVRLLKDGCYTVLITTDKVYHNNEWVYPYRETDRLGGYDPYSASKACSELVIDSYRKSFFSTNDFEIHRKAIAVARAGNVIGGGDWSRDRLIPDIIRALSKGNAVKIRNPNSVRPWQHVLEPLWGYLLLGAKLTENPQQFSQAYNFGPELKDALPVIDMVELAIADWGGGDYILDQDEQPHEAGLLKLDISKAANELNWLPRMSAEKAIQNTVSWYKKYLEDPSKISKYTEEQIIEFFS